MHPPLLPRRSRHGVCCGHGAGGRAATAAGTTVSPVHGSLRVPHQVPGGYCRRLLPMIIISCLAQGCFAVAPDAEMMAQLAQLSSSFGLAVLLTGLASIAVTPTARKLISIAADACSVTSDSPPDDAATCSEKEGVAPTPLTVKKEGAALPPGLNVHAWPPLLTAVSGPCTRSNKEGVAAVNSNAACDGLSRGPPQSATAVGSANSTWRYAAPLLWGCSWNAWLCQLPLLQAAAARVG